MPFTPRVIVNNDFRSAANTSGATLPKGTIVKLSAAADDTVILPTAVGDAVWGVTTADIPNNTVGTVQIRGRALVLIGTGGVVRGDKLTHDTAIFGSAKTAAPAAGTNNALLGIAARTSAISTLAEVELAGPGAFFQG